MTTVKASFANNHPIKVFLLKVVGILVLGAMSALFAHVLIRQLFPEANSEQLIVLPFAVAIGAMGAWIKPVTALATAILAAAVVILCFAILEPDRLWLASSLTLIFAPFALPFVLEKLYRLIR
mgnify:CR=1 FL=1